MRVPLGTIPLFKIVHYIIGTRQFVHNYITSLRSVSLSPRWLSALLWSAFGQWPPRTSFVEIRTSVPGSFHSASSLPFLANSCFAAIHLVLLLVLLLLLLVHMSAEPMNIGADAAAAVGHKLNGGQSAHHIIYNISLVRPSTHQRR